LGGLIATSEQQNKLSGALMEIDSVSWSVIDAKLADTDPD